MATTNFTVRMDSELKAEAEALYAELGLNMTTAINIFLRQSLRSGGFPFKIKLETEEKEPSGKEKASKKAKRAKKSSLSASMKND